MHPALFAFGPAASIKSLPELNVAVRLAEEMLMDGFLTQAEPVQITVVVVSDTTTTGYDTSGTTSSMNRAICSSACLYESPSRWGKIVMCSIPSRSR